MQRRRLSPSLSLPALLLFFFLLLLAVAAVEEVAPRAAAAARRRRRRRRRRRGRSVPKIDLAALERAWADGDEGEGEENHDDARQQPQHPPPPPIAGIHNGMSREELRANIKQRRQQGIGGVGNVGVVGGSDTGAHMSFTRVRESWCQEREDAGRFKSRKACLEFLAAKWTSQLRLNDLERLNVKLFVIEPGTVLCSDVLQPHQVKELKTFMLAQPEVVAWTHESKDHFPDGVQPPKDILPANGQWPIHTPKADAAYRRQKRKKHKKKKQNQESKNKRKTTPKTRRRTKKRKKKKKKKRTQKKVVEL